MGSESAGGGGRGRWAERLRSEKEWTGGGRKRSALPLRSEEGTRGDESASALPLRLEEEEERPDVAERRSRFEVLEAWRWGGRRRDTRGTKARPRFRYVWRRRRGGGTKARPRFRYGAGGGDGRRKTKARPRFRYGEGGRGRAEGTGLTGGGGEP
jgi:hypothetical protein